MKRICEKLSLVVILACSSRHFALSQDYAKEMKGLVQGTLKIDYRKYQFFGIPMSGFGVGTMYPQAVVGGKIDIKTEGIFGDPRTWWIDGIDNASRDKLTGTIFSYGDSPTIQLSGKKSRSLSISTALPALYKVLSASGGVDWNKSTTVTLSADKATNHLINWSALDEAVNGEPPKTPVIRASVARHFHAQDFVITVGDVVLTNFKAHVAVTRSLSATAKAQLDQAVAAFAKDTKLSFDYKSNGDGSYDLIAKDPVVAAVFIGAPPTGSLRAAGAVALTPVMTPGLIRQLEKAQLSGSVIPEN
jgi:hypothetical protein